MTILFVFLGIALVAFLGMFYWMYKAKSGTLHLNSNSWHFKLLHYMWEITTADVKNACPYYWALVLSILLIVPYHIIWAVYKTVSPIVRLISYSTKGWFSGGEAKWMDKLPSIPKINVPTTLKEIFSLVYRKSKLILTWMFGIFVTLTVLVMFFYMLIKPFYVMNLYVASTIAFFITWTTSSSIISILVPEWDEYHVKHYKDFASGLMNTCILPFVVVGKLIGLLFSFIGGVYSDNCPPIEWK